LFALALCVKQHFIVGPVLSTCLLLAAGWRRRLAIGRIVAGLLTGLGVLLAVFAAEEYATGGQTSQAVFVAAAHAARVHPANWFRTEVVLLAVFGRSSGLIAVLTASALALVPIHANLGRPAFVASGTILVGLIILLAALEHVITIPLQTEISLLAVIAAVIIVLPLCALVEPRSLARGGIDGALWLYLAGELALLVVLCRSSTGAWVNYAIPAVVIASVLTARILDRALNETVTLSRLLPIILAASIVPIGTIVDPYETAVRREYERRAIAQIFQETGRPQSEFFFVGRPGDNRVFGRLNLVYDEWLYPVFESLNLAERRSSWLRRALVAGPVHFVVNTSADPKIDGVGSTLPELGYTRRIQVGPFYVWERIRSSSRQTQIAPTAMPPRRDRQRSDVDASL
jgi:hypothetical protein